MNKHFTIGYGGMTVHDFIKKLIDAGVDTVFDIRTFPKSWNENFNHKKLESLLKKKGIRYKWVRELGGKIKFDDSVRIAHFPQDSDGKVAFMCSEKSRTNCHRKELAELFIRKFGAEIVELNDEKAEPTQDELPF